MTLPKRSLRGGHGCQRAPGAHLTAKQSSATMTRTCSLGWDHRQLVQDTSWQAASSKADISWATVWLHHGSQQHCIVSSQLEHTHPVQGRSMTGKLLENIPLCCFWMKCQTGYAACGTYRCRQWLNALPGSRTSCTSDWMHSAGLRISLGAARSVREQARSFAAAPALEPPVFRSDLRDADQSTPQFKALLLDAAGTLLAPSEPAAQARSPAHDLYHLAIWKICSQQQATSLQVYLRYGARFGITRSEAEVLAHFRRRATPSCHSLSLAGSRSEQSMLPSSLIC